MCVKSESEYGSHLFSPQHQENLSLVRIQTLASLIQQAFLNPDCQTYQKRWCLKRYVPHCGPATWIIIGNQCQWCSSGNASILITIFLSFNSPKCLATWTADSPAFLALLLLFKLLQLCYVSLVSTKLIACFIRNNLAIFKSLLIYNCLETACDLLSTAFSFE